MDFGYLDRWIDRVGAEPLMSGLAPFLTEARRARIDEVLAGRLESLQVAFERPEVPRNVAAVVRSAEALGAMHVHVVDAPADELKSPEVTRGAWCWIHTHHHQSLDELLAVREQTGLYLAGAMMDGAVTVEQLPADRPLCLLFGNEGEGLSAAARAACDVTFRVPMVGMTESMNVSVAAALSLYSTARARREYLKRPGDLEGERLQRERARYFARSVEERLLVALFGEL